MNRTFNYSQSFVMQRSVYAVTVPLLLTYCLLSFLVNASILCTVPFMKKSLNLTLKLTISLVLTDICTTAAMSFSLVYNSYLYFVYKWRTNPCVSLTSEAVRMGGFFSGLCHLLALAINHYMSISHPFVLPTLMTPRKVNILLGVMWVAPTAIMLGVFSLIPGQGYRSPKGHCEQLAFAYQLEYRVIISSLIILFIILMAIIYTMVTVKLRRQEHANVRKTSTANRQMRMVKRNKGTLKTTLLLWSAFFLGWFPTCVFFVLTCDRCAYSFKHRMDPVIYVLGFVSAFSILTKTFVNPIIYAVRIPEIRSVLLGAKFQLMKKMSVYGGGSQILPPPPPSASPTIFVKNCGNPDGNRVRLDRQFLSIPNNNNGGGGGENLLSPSFISLNEDQSIGVMASRQTRSTLVPGRSTEWCGTML